MRKVEQAIRGVEDEQWKRSNPEARARAADTVAQLEASLAEREEKRARAEAAPRSFLGRLWHWHTRWCPGWKAYQRSLATCQQTDRENA